MSKQQVLVVIPAGRIEGIVASGYGQVSLAEEWPDTIKIYDSWSKVPRKWKYRASFVMCIPSGAILKNKYVRHVKGE